MGEPSGPTAPPSAARRRFARRLAVRGGRQGWGGACPPLPTVIVSRAGGLAARPGSCGRIVDRGRNLRTGESQNAGGVVDVGIARGRRTAGGTRGAVAGKWRAD